MVWALAGVCMSMVGLGIDDLRAGLSAGSGAD
jgi:hypothetical protein